MGFAAERARTIREGLPTSYRSCPVDDVMAAWMRYTFSMMPPRWVYIVSLLFSNCFLSVLGLAALSCSIIGVLSFDISPMVLLVMADYRENIIDEALVSRNKRERGDTFIVHQIT